MFIYNITEVNICVSLHKNPDVTIAEMTLLHIHHVNDPIESLF